MYPTETQLVAWECPDCTGKQEEILIANMELPEVLICSDCGHQSDPLTWEEK